jgi:nucleoside-diphosphate-sugar epimerase
MRAFVTGGTGFFGSHIVEASLEWGDEVRALARAQSDTRFLEGLGKVELVHGDLGAVAPLVPLLEGVDVVFHSAARVKDYGSRKDFYDTNVKGTERLLEAAQKAKVPRFVFISSPSVVMNGEDQLDIDERTPYSRRYFNLYSETKAAAEQRVLASNGPDFITCSLRPRGIWGPRDLHGAIPKMLKRMKLGKLPRMPRGQRPTLVDLCYAGNGAHACMLAARSDKVGGKAYFISDGTPVDVWAFTDELADRYGIPRITRSVSPRLLWAIATVIETVWRIPALHSRYPPPLSRYLVSLLSHCSTYDLSAAKRDFGYAPIVDRATGLARIDEWLGDGGLAAYLRHV